MDEDDYTRLSVAALASAYRIGTADPVEVTTSYLDRIDDLDGSLRSFVTVTRELALTQAASARDRIAAGESAPLLGIPVSIKDAFHVKGVPTTLGSLLHRDHVAKSDSGVVRRLRSSGAVFTGKTNTAEFGQSATTDNLLGPDTANPWDLTRTPGGSSGGAAASVAAGLSLLAVGSDGGGSIRIPAAFTGLYGFKPTRGLVNDEKGFRAMTDFVSAGPLASSVADARLLLGVLAEATYTRGAPGRLRIAYSRRPEGRPVHPGILAALDRTAEVLEALGHHVEHADAPIDDWNIIFGPLVLEDEHRERGHLLRLHAEALTQYERATLRAAVALDPARVARAHERLPAFRDRIAEFLSRFDLLLTPTTAVPAFPLGQRPESIDGTPVDALWGAFPFAAPYNVAGVAAAAIPCGLVDGLPISAQLVTADGADGVLLDVSEQLEEALDFDRTALVARWSRQRQGVR